MRAHAICGATVVRISARHGCLPLHAVSRPRPPGAPLDPGADEATCFRPPALECVAPCDQPVHGACPARRAVRHSSCRASYAASSSMSRAASAAGRLAVFDLRYRRVCSGRRHREWSGHRVTVSSIIRSIGYIGRASWTASELKHTCIAIPIYKNRKRRPGVKTAMLQGFWAPVVPKVSPAPQGSLKSQRGERRTRCNGGAPTARVANVAP